MDKALPSDRATAAEPVVSALRDGIPSAEGLVRLIAEYGGYGCVPSSEFQRRYPAFEQARRVHIDRGDTSLEATLATLVDWAEMIAQAMSAREGQDPQGLGVKPASAVAESHAPNTHGGGIHDR